jgi:hypothetical protein
MNVAIGKRGASCELRRADYGPAGDTARSNPYELIAGFVELALQAPDGLD